ncbi:CRISPR-associated endonuclease Cas2 [Acinetobacter sp. NIPH 1869]|uniref:CRISPR-associated endonuclease Cas2 n=1 Tax=Acinetobacter higginsii TaxID=70347 RepID=UPI001F4BBF81|nr:CRISPR-associated endonuclease Cas2 [Acinetobacter higginsii]MCH7306278.1 CRISPR-associated endonuclease Cas2 [Acinetobacter higginsii]
MPAYHWICCYDIRDAKRLAKVHQILSMLGIALNYSVFYLYLTLMQFEQLCRRLKKLIKAEDDLRLYWSSALIGAQYVGNKALDGVNLVHARGSLL